MYCIIQRSSVTYMPDITKNVILGTEILFVYYEMHKSGSCISKECICSIMLL